VVQTQVLHLSASWLNCLSSMRFSRHVRFLAATVVDFVTVTIHATKTPDSEDDITRSRCPGVGAAVEGAVP
jgi:hypothetical protein